LYTYGEADVKEHSSTEHLFKDGPCIVIDCNAIDLDFTNASTPATGDGYAWDADSKTLTLTKSINGNVTLPGGVSVTIIVNGEFIINELKSISSQEPDLTISNGTTEAPCTLTLKGNTNITGNECASLTVDKGVSLVAEKSITVGGQGDVNGAVNVYGTLVAKSDEWAAVSTGNVTVHDGGSLEVTGNVGVVTAGTDVTGNVAYTNAFELKDGGSFKADCTGETISVSVPADYLKTPDNLTAEAAAVWLENAIEAIINIPEDYLPDDNHKVALKKGADTACLFETEQPRLTGLSHQLSGEGSPDTKDMANAALRSLFGKEN
ncbi:MAG: hypothetical protein K2N36_04770, partial [Ruminiclostridium sp.]|nr:hypothetical protein [Ruminiclostridium sp.]